MKRSLPDRLVPKTPRVRHWDGHFYQVRQCALVREPERRPHENVFNTMEALACWMITLKGRAIYEVPGHRIDVTPGTVVCFHQPSRSLWFTPPEVDRWERLFVHFTGELAVGYFNHLVARYGYIHRLPARSTPVRLARELVAMVRQRPAPSAHAWSLQTFAFLTEWHRWLDAHPHTVPPGMRLAAKDSRLISYGPKTIKRFAEQMGYSRSYLTKRLHEQWDGPPGKVLRRVRLEEAARLLRTTNHPVHLIAARIGFRSPSAFSAAFLRRYSIAPLGYRRQQR